MPSLRDTLAQQVIGQMVRPRGVEGVPRPISGQAIIDSYYKGQENRRAQENAKSLQELRQAQIAESQQRAITTRMARERDRVKNLREDEVGFIETSTRNLMPALEVYEQDPFTANRVYSEQMRSIRSAYPDLAARLPQSITRDNYPLLLGMAESGIQDLATRRSMLLEEQRAKGKVPAGAKAGMEEVAKQHAKSLQKRADVVQEQAMNAVNSTRNLAMAKNTLNQGLETGAFAPAIASVNRYLVDAGIDIPGLNKVKDVEVFNSMVSKEIVTSLSEMDKPSDQDAKLVERTIPTLGTSQAAAKFLLDAAIAVNQRKMEKNDFYEQYWNSERGYEGVEKAWGSFVKNTPLVGKNKNTGAVKTWPEFKEAYFQKWPTDSMENAIDSWNGAYAH